MKEVGGPAYPPAVNAVQAKAAGYWAFQVPKEAGGAGIPFMYYVLVNEILGRSRDMAASVCQGGANETSRRARWALPATDRGRGDA